MKMTYRISNPLINEQKAAALADVRVRQHDFCEWINGLDALGASNRTIGNSFVLQYQCICPLSNSSKSTSLAAPQPAFPLSILPNDPDAICLLCTAPFTS